MTQGPISNLIPLGFIVLHVLSVSHKLYSHFVNTTPYTLIYRLARHHINFDFDDLDNTLTSTNYDNDNDTTQLDTTTTTGTTTFATLTWTNGPLPVSSIHLHSRLASLTFASQWLLTALYSCASVDFLAL
jgi:hypothetical protein